MGYANPAQLSSGIHTRQYARAFVMEYEKTRVVYVNVDCAMIDQIVKSEVRAASWISVQLSFADCSLFNGLQWLSVGQTKHTPNHRRKRCPKRMSKEKVASCRIVHAGPLI